MPCERDGRRVPPPGEMALARPDDAIGMAGTAGVDVAALVGGTRRERPLVDAGLHWVLFLVVLGGTLFWSVVGLGVAALV